MKTFKWHYEDQYRNKIDICDLYQKYYIQDTLAISNLCRIFVGHLAKVKNDLCKRAGICTHRLQMWLTCDCSPPHAHHASWKILCMTSNWMVHSIHFIHIVLSLWFHTGGERLSNMCNWRGHLYLFVEKIYMYSLP